MHFFVLSFAHKLLFDCKIYNTQLKAALEINKAIRMCNYGAISRMHTPAFIKNNKYYSPSPVTSANKAVN